MNIRSIALFVLLASVGLTGFNVASAGESPATIALNRPGFSRHSVAG
jgi:hypothetical protein